MELFGYYSFSNEGLKDFLSRYALRLETSERGHTVMKYEDKNVSDFGNSMHFQFVHETTFGENIYRCGSYGSCIGSNEELIKELYSHKVDECWVYKVLIDSINFSAQTFAPISKEKEFLEIEKGQINDDENNCFLYMDGIYRILKDLGLPTFNDNDNYSLTEHADDLLIYDIVMEKVNGGYLLDIITTEDMWDNGVEYSEKYYLQVIHDGAYELLCKVHNLTWK